MQRLNRTPLVFVLMLLLGGCASLGYDFEQPQVKVTSLRMLPPEGLGQRFAIGLSVTNPNATSLNLVGMSYSLRIQGYDLLSGVTNDIPTLEAYTETPLEITASVNLINSLRFVQSLLRQPSDVVDYELVAKLDVGSSLLPAVRIVEAGEITLGRP